ncbi:ABC transporter ATP-binding protein [uncultured Thermanaerothrix sp.]|uniref:ABC transporter ATP-binding protein n=1 Tax=uncultured Thermanaerothrix sp. TaxID=1195149 RepID=UPI002618BAC4|nr:ABC transporter ATP-binding protein [uncultured Thermanaerothrix sp.]
MSELPLVIENLTFRYRSRNEPAIRNINLRVQPGQVVLIAGASGCGKTTLIRCINGLIPRSYKGELTGSVRIFGQDTRGLSLARISQMVGTVLQDPERQILGSRVINEVAFGLENLGLPREEILRRAQEALERLKIAHLRDRETFNLSGGEKQKVALAGVLAMRPGILLLDEPLASLDPASAQDALRMIRQLADEGMTVILIEHRVEDVLAIHPERVLYMSDGEIKFDGTAEQLADYVDYREVKLPAPMILNLAARMAPPPEPQWLPSGREGQREPLVEFQGVHFGYENGMEILHGVDLTIYRGDIIAVLGPNGAGKTTLIKHAIGLLKPKRGRVLIRGRDTRQMSVAEIASTLGYVFQSPSHMLFAPTVYEELAFGPRNLNHDPETIRKEVMEAIEIVNLKGYEQIPPLSMSFGQQKRVSIAAILSMRSRILVMDEPTAGQDYKNYISFMDSILQMPGFEAILFITHDVDVAIRYANRVLLVNEGRVVADGTPEEVLSDLERLETCRLVPTSLLRLNLDYLPSTRRFLSAEVLAHFSLA